MIQDPISEELIHTMGALFVDDTDLYTWREQIMDPGKLWCQTQIELKNLSTERYRRSPQARKMLLVFA